MKRFFGIWIIFTALTASSAVAQNNQPAAPRPVRPRAEATVADVVQGLYTGEFQKQVQVSDEQYVKILPILRNGIEVMRTNADKSLRAINQLTQLVRRNAPEEQIEAQIRILDEADRQTRAAQQLFVTKIDPFLTSPQKARFRLFQTTFDQRLRGLVQRARQLGQPLEQQPQ